MKRVVTVGELIEKLSEFPADLPVMTEDYEEGASIATEVTIGDYPSPRHVVIR